MCVTRCGVGIVILRGLNNVASSRDCSQLRRQRERRRRRREEEEEEEEEKEDAVTHWLAESHNKQNHNLLSNIAVPAVLTFQLGAEGVRL